MGKNKTNQSGYLVVLRPIGEHRYDDVAYKCETDSIDNKICGMGWGKEFFDDKGNKKLELHSGNNYNTHLKWNRNNAKTSALNKYRDIKPKDYVLTRLRDGYCYIGKVETHAYHDFEQLFDNYDYYSWVVETNWKKRKKYEFHELPSAIQGVMSGRIGTIKRLDDLHTHILKRMYEGKRVGKYKLNIDNFHEALSAEDLENLVAYYMRRKHKSYFLIPSTCKKDYPLYEFVMINENDERITCQVKNNDVVDTETYKSDYFKTIYLFSGINDYGNEEPTGNLKVIKRNDLFDIIVKQFDDEKGFFFNELKDYYEIQL